MLALPAGTSNTPQYMFGLAARLMTANKPCVQCHINPGFTIKSLCENCAPLQEVLDTAFSILASRERPLPDQPGYYAAGFAGLDQVEAALITLARHLGLEQRLFFPTTNLKVK